MARLPKREPLRPSSRELPRGRLLSIAYADGLTIAYHVPREGGASLALAEVDGTPVAWRRGSVWRWWGRRVRVLDDADRRRLEGTPALATARPAGVVRGPRAKPAPAAVLPGAEVAYAVTIAATTKNARRTP